jgi:tripartite-type tricarboxylate transporter receptor subunit TctC
MMHGSDRRAAVMAAAVILFVGLTGVASAQSYPDKPIKIIVPSAAAKPSPQC